jgi:hypothetical protein
VTAQQVFGIIAGCIGVLVFLGGIGATLIMLGRRYGEATKMIEHLTHAVDKVESLREKLEIIPEILSRLGNVESVQSRNTSDIKGLIEKQGYVRGRLDSADFNGTGGGNDD